MNKQQQQQKKLVKNYRGLRQQHSVVKLKSSESGCISRLTSFDITIILCWPVFKLCSTGADLLKSRLNNTDGSLAAHLGLYQPWPKNVVERPHQSFIAGLW